MKRRYLLPAAALAVVIAGILLVPRIFPKATFRVVEYVEHKLSRLEEKELVAAKHTVRYLEGGPKDAPVVLLLHGFDGNKDNWTRLSRELTKKYHVFAPDLPGSGESSQINSEYYDIASQADRVAEIARALKLPPHHVAGNSVGGHVAAAYAHRFPDNVKSLCLIDTAGIKAPRENEYAVRRARGERPLLIDTREQYEEFLKMVFVKRPWAPRVVTEQFAEQAMKHRPFYEKIMIDMEARPYPLEPVLPQIAAPILVIWGSEDRFFDVSTVEVIEQLVPSAKVEVFSDVGHAPMMERPGETAKTYSAFMRSTFDRPPQEQTATRETP
jgi:abhydrolase domain-containing protein 6